MLNISLKFFSNFVVELHFTNVFLRYYALLLGIINLIVK
jgi:hypothetical protein